jgi:hypothetical protein
MEIIIHGRSGSVALPRVNVTAARPARAELICLPARSAERTAEVRRRDDAIVVCLRGIGEGLMAVFAQ